LTQHRRIRLVQWGEVRIPCADAGDTTHRNGGSQFPGDVPQRALVVGATTVDLVHEDESGNAQALQGAHQHAGLRLDALDGRDDENGAVEHAQHALHLGDEVRVAGGVDQVDGDVTDGEGDDGGLDRDAARPFQGQGVGLGVAVIDTADRVDDTGGMQQPLGQAGLTGVDMRHDPEVQSAHRRSCPLCRQQYLLGWT
jgi:hypothetical protein